MSYAQKIKVKRLAAGGSMLVSKFPSHGQVSIVGSVAGGARLAGSDMLAEAHAAMLLEGTKKHSKSAIQVALDEMGASLAFSVERDRLVFNGHVRGEYLKKLLALIAEALKEPVFPSKELKYYKERATSELALEAQETRTQAAIGLSQLLYAADHPNHQESTERSLADLERLTRADLLKYLARAIDAKTLVVSVCSDMPVSAVRDIVVAAFAGLPKRDVSLPAFEAAASPARKTAAKHIADKASIDYMLGISTGITKEAPDFPALELGLQVLGYRGGFNGRLMKTVREQEGLTYGVYAYPAGFSNADGYIAVWATFAPSMLERGKAAVMREIKKIVEEGVTDIEVKKHRTMYEAKSRVSLANSADLARAAHLIGIEGRQPSYLDDYPQRMLKVTRAQVNAALKKYLVPEKLSESSAGPVES